MFYMQRTKKPEDYNLGENLRKAREEAGFTQLELANALGVLQKDISRWERNIQVPNVITFRKICTILNTSSDYVLALFQP